MHSRMSVRIAAAVLGLLLVPVAGADAATHRQSRGTVAAVPMQAVADGTATRISVRLSRGTTARSLAAGVYASRRGRPGRRLAAGRVAVAKPGWERVGIRPVRIHAGRRYWIALQGLGGGLRLDGKRGCRARLAAGRPSRLPKRWRTAARSRTCPALSSLRLQTEGEPPAGEEQRRATYTLASPPQALVDDAIAQKFIRFGRRYAGGGMTNDSWNVGPTMILAAASYAGNTSADARLLAQVRDLIAGGNEPASNGGYPAQHERFGNGMLAVVHNTPRVWAQLSAAERHKIDLVMMGGLVSSGYTTSDTNPGVAASEQQYTLDGDDNIDREWNPNFREGMVGMMVVAAAYFGPATAEQILASYDHDAFLADLRANGLTNLAETFNWRADHPTSNAPTGDEIEQVVHGYRYKDTRLTDPMRIYWLVTEDTYQKRVNCGLNDGAGIATSEGPAGVIDSGCEGLPNKGAVGMLKEFDVIDAGGKRSSAGYSYAGSKVNLVNHYVLLASGLWQQDTYAAQALARMSIGIPDLWYKLDHGYRGYAKGEAQWVAGAIGDPYVFKSDNPEFAFPANRSLWEDVVRRFHGI